MDSLPLELLSTENGIWVLVTLVAVREYFRLSRDRQGPAWVRNGMMERVLDQIVSRIEDSPKQVEMRGRIRRIEETGERTWDIHDRRDLDGQLKWDFPSNMKKMEERLKKGQEQFWPPLKEVLESTALIGDKMASCSDHLEKHAEHLESQSKVLRAVVKELASTPKCPYQPDARLALAEDVERRKRLDAQIRAEELGLDPEETKK